MCTYDKFAENGRVNQGLVAMVDGMRHGTALVGPAGRVRFSNTAAEDILRAADGLSLHAQCITATAGATQAHLGKAIHHAVVGDRDGIRYGHSMLHFNVARRHGPGSAPWRQSCMAIRQESPCPSNESG